MSRAMFVGCLATLLAVTASADALAQQLQQAQDAQTPPAPAPAPAPVPLPAPVPAPVPVPLPVPVPAPAPVQQTATSSLQFDNNAAQPVLNPGQGQAVAPAAQGQFGGGSASQGMATNPMGALLGGLLGQQPGGSFNQGNQISNAPLVTNGKVNSQVLSTDSQQVVSGLIEAFMHRYQLQPGEKSCLENNIEGLTGSVMGVIGDAAVAIKDLVAGHGNIQKSSQGDFVSAGTDAAMKVTSLVGSATGLAKGCVHGDALVMLKTAAQHMTNAKYLKHRFIVSGVDIVGELADAVDAFERHDFHKFGSDIGTALRKVLLSESNKATRLPEGVPEEAIIQEVTEGFMGGFFVNGESLEITDSVRPDVDIRIDLHQCVVGNAAFFKEIWVALWNVIARLSAHTLGSDVKNMFGQQGGGQPKWAGELMVAMMQFPSVLQNCGLNMGMQHMLMEAIKTLGDLQVHFTFPHDQIQAGKATDEMAQAVAAWTNWNFKLFGQRLGVVFRQLLMLAFPQKYSIDASGRLQAKLETQEKSVSAVPITIGAAMTLFGAFALVRTRRSVPKESSTWCQLADSEHMVPMTDIEDGEEVE